MLRTISLALCLLLSMAHAAAQDVVGMALKAVEKSTLDQPGTKPFHLRATYAPSLVLGVLEPLPASDTMTESDWRIKRDTLEGISLVRVFRGPESPSGELDPAHSSGFWFTSNGTLYRSYTQGLDVRPADFQPYEGLPVARQYQLRRGSQLAMSITVTEITSAPSNAAHAIPVKGHEWQRAFTGETR